VTLNRTIPTIPSMALAFLLTVGCSAVQARLSPPSNVSAAPASSRVVELSWTDQNADIVGFVIERSTDAKRKFKPVTTTGGDARLYRDQGLAAGTTYYYRVLALQEVRTKAGKLRKPRKSKRSKVTSATTYLGDPPAPVPTATPPGADAGEWARRMGGTGHDIGVATAADASGNVVVTGRFTGTADFGGGPLASAGGFDVFLAKYASDGTHLWSRRFGATGNDLGNGVAIDAAGNVVIVGSFEQTVSFGGGSRTSAGGWDVFVAKYSPEGSHLWSMSFGGPESDSGLAVGIGPDGGVVVGGSYRGTVSFGGPPLSTSRAAVTDLFAAKYSSGGGHQWSLGFKSDRKGQVRGVAVDTAGNVALTGFFEGSVDLGGGSLQSVGSSRDAFVARLSPAGGHLWSRRFGAIVTDVGNGVAVDGNGDVLVTGMFGSAVDFGGGALQGDAAGDAFVAKYAAATGAHLWSLALGGRWSADAGWAVAVGDGNDVIVGGTFEATDAYPADFGGGPVVSAGRQDVFVARYSPGGVHLRSERFGGPEDDVANGIAVDSAGHPIVTGTFGTAADFAGRLLVSAGGLDAFVMKLRP
jgi:hypothetical protein